jgi:hypothetical protein
MPARAFEHRLPLYADTWLGFSEPELRDFLYAGGFLTTHRHGLSRRICAAAIFLELHIHENEQGVPRSMLPSSING